MPTQFYMPEGQRESFGQHAEFYISARNTYRILGNITY